MAVGTSLHDSYQKRAAAVLIALIHVACPCSASDGREYANRALFLQGQYQTFIDGIPVVGLFCTY